MPKLTAVPKYRAFINDRDRALEVFHRNAQKEVSDLSHDAFKHILFIVAHRYRLVNDHTRFTNRGRMIVDSISSEVDHTMRMLAQRIVAPILKMRKQTNILAYAGELEAMARVLGKNFHARHRVPDTNTQALEARMYQALTRLRDRVNQVIGQGYVNKTEFNDVYSKVLKVFPKVKRFRQPPRELKPLHEADAKDWTDSATVNFIDDGDWHELVDQYKNAYVPKTRDLSFDVDTGEPELEEWYGWEIEQEITDDFLNQVKAGQVDAATEAGISDLMWVSILDDKTRDEHRLKNGLTSSEIQAKLDNEWSDFDDRSTVAPGGFRCRCRSVPYVANLPEENPVSYGDFNQWLNAA